MRKTTKSPGEKIVKDIKASAVGSTMLPVLLHAELYEGGELVQFGADPVTEHTEWPGKPMR
ncbi:hypothetical protein VK792_19010 [Mesobacterium sp. TK19101]|uniref:Uncharacterized protein n=1 Tax=Mesobacterium hydrothermale TaxID=3111907 RepID=A0ABU6HLR1_9RHOB|nr:hypothetical protein [Mesobacterium sp. TK19101]MEC3863384.1 hypothetical protein [Mesobacterium sp. TK19101]